MFEYTSNDELFKLIRAGNKKAFNTFFSRLYPVLCSYAMQYVEYEEGQDIVQDVMLWVWENQKKLEIKETIEDYLFIAIRNKCFTLINRKGVKTQFKNIRLQQTESLFMSPNFYVIKELEENIKRVVDNLPMPYREAFVMNRFQNKTYKEIASILNLSPKTIDYRIQQALKILRIELREYLESV